MEDQLQSRATRIQFRKFRKSNLQLKGEKLQLQWQKKQKRGEIYFLQAENKSAPFFCIIGIFACLTRENWRSSMNCLEKEIDSALAEQNLAHEKVRNNELAKLIAKLTRSFFSSETKSLDPFYLKNTQKKTQPRLLEKSRHSRKFWKPLANSSRQ